MTMKTTSGKRSGGIWNSWKTLDVSKEWVVLLLIVLSIGFGGLMLADPGLALAIAFLLALVAFALKRIFPHLIAFVDFVKCRIPSRRGLARGCVMIYIICVGVSLFRVPWDGWAYGEAQIAPSVKRWSRIIKMGTIFSPPEKLLGANPNESNYIKALEVPPIMRPERLLILWAAGALITSSAAWLLLSKSSDV